MVRKLGFADLLCGFDSQHGEGQVRTAIDAVARILELPVAAPEKLARYVGTQPDDMFAPMPGRTIRTLTGMVPEQLASTMLGELDVRDRSYRMRTYDQCFLGTEATDWLQQRFRVARADAVQLGNALVELSLLMHVGQEHPFRDEPLFYTLAGSAEAGQIDLGSTLSLLTGTGGVAIADRSYHGRNYEQCWVGSEAIDCLVASGMRRHDAWIVMHRLAQCGVFEHVTSERPFLDGEFFYRFTGTGNHPVL